MAHESFSDPTTASAMNAAFVNVKVDREERPDVDAVYMAATQAMTGNGGWPMTVFADTSGRPFFCGTYFPPRPRGDVPGFLQVLAKVAAAWAGRRADVTQVGEAVATRMARLAVPAGVPGRAGSDIGAGAVAPPAGHVLEEAVARLAGEFSDDAQHGGLGAGFGGAPKFPPSMTLLQLLRHHERTGSGQALDMVTATCVAMARGGIYDQLGGGFSRYSVDAMWNVPHFEKMLYDNALLLRVYALAWRATSEPLFRRIAEETAGFMIRELGTAAGAFASALDADTDGVEGLTYVWTFRQLVDALGEDDAKIAAAAYEVTEDGNFENDASVLRLAADGALDADFERVAGRLRVARTLRPQPARDDKIVASWNGLAISALVEASIALDRPDLLAAALRCGHLLLNVHMVNGRLVRTSRDGKASQNPGVLEDYGCVAEAFVMLYSATGDRRWLLRASALLETVRDQFRTPEGFYDTAADAVPLYFRPSDPTDNANPSGTSAAAAAFAAYAVAAPSIGHLDDAYLALVPSAALADQAPRFAGYGLAVAEALTAETPRSFLCPGPFCED